VVDDWHTCKLFEDCESNLQSESVNGLLEQLSIEDGEEE